jgi:hypothetical protein
VEPTIATPHLSTHPKPSARPASPGDALLSALSPAEEALITVLLKRSLLSTEQVRSAQLYGQEHNRDLRQAILELNLISPDVLNQLAFERLTALAGDNGQPGTASCRRSRSPPRSPSWSTTS